MIVYCMKCQKKVQSNNMRDVTMRSGRLAKQGTCPKCGTSVFSIDRQ